MQQARHESSVTPIKRFCDALHVANGEHIHHSGEPGRNVEARCPAHEDQTASLSIGVGDDGRVLVFCHAGCGTHDICKAIGLTVAELMPANEHRPMKPKIVKVYNYRDENGTLLFQVCRMVPKSFRQRRPDGKGGFVWSVKGVRQVPYRLPELLASPGKVVFIVEGEKDADRLASLGCIATCNAGGAGKWRKDFAEHFRGRKVVVLPDNDDPGREHARDVARSLIGVAESVRVLELPELPLKGDVSGWLDAGGTREQLTELVEATPDWTEDPGSDKKPEESVDDPYRLARVVLDRFPHLVHFQGEFFQFIQPAYKTLSEDDVRAMVVPVIKSEFDLEALEAEIEKPRKITRPLIGSTVECLKALAHEPSTREAPFWLGNPICRADRCFVTKNATVDLEAVQGGSIGTFPPTADLFTTNAVDYAFDPHAECPAWFNFLDQLWGITSDQVLTLQEMAGYFLSDDTSQQKIFMLIGGKRAGKGTIARVFRSLIGPQNVCNPILGGLQGDFGLEGLIGKRLAIVGDARLSGRADAEVIVERLLSISGEDSLSIKRKFKSEVTTQLKARFLLISNELPRLNDASATLPSRVILLRFAKSFYGTENHNLTEQLLEERPGILLWALAGWERLRNRGHFVQPEESRELIAQMEELSSPVLAFINEQLKLEAGSQTLVKDVFGAWKIWCDEKGRRPGNEQSFGRDLRAALPAVNMSRPRIEGRQVRVYEGIGLKGEHDW